MRFRDFNSIQNFPLTRTQDGTGLCYAFTATQLLNYHYCKTKNKDCSDPNEQLSVLDVASYQNRNLKGIQNGGVVAWVLSNFKAKNTPKLNSEECLPFEKLAHSSPRLQGKEQREGYDFLKSLFDENLSKMDYEQKMCRAKLIKQTFPLNKDTSEIFAQLEAKTLEEFVYNMAVKSECENPESKLDVPNYQIGSYPRRGEKTDLKTTLAVMEKLILNDIPFSLSFCAGTAMDKNDVLNTCQGHGVIVKGIKEVCKGAHCKTMLQIKNSYGQSWQELHDDGWVDADTLIERAILLGQGKYDFINWIGESGSLARIPDKKLQRSVSKSSAKGSSKPAKASPPSTSLPPEDIDMSRKPIFKCGNSFTDRWQGKNCKFLQYTK